MIVLASVTEKLRELGIFNDVGDSVDAAQAITEFVARPPAAYVATSREQASANEMSTGFRQRVLQTVSVLFVIGQERKAKDTADAVEAVKAAIVKQLTAWEPEGAMGVFNYVSYSMRFAGDGLIWGECLFSAPYYIRG